MLLGYPFGTRECHNGNVSPIFPAVLLRGVIESMTPFILPACIPVSAPILCWLPAAYILYRRPAWPRFVKNRFHLPPSPTSPLECSDGRKAAPMVRTGYYESMLPPVPAALPWPVSLLWPSPASFQIKSACPINPAVYCSALPARQRLHFVARSCLIQSSLILPSSHWPSTWHNVPILKTPSRSDSWHPLAFPIQPGTFSPIIS